jgi:DNA polymerase-1
MIAIAKEIAAQKLRSRMILQVHDELLFEVAPGEMDRLTALVRPAMENVQTLRVPLLVDMKVGPNWRDMEALRP